MDWGRDAAATVDEDAAVEVVDWHDWSVAEKTTELYCLAYTLADDWNDADSCGFLVDHTDG